MIRLTDCGEGSVQAPQLERQLGRRETGGPVLSMSNVIDYQAVLK
jgi:hypothetical protein